MAKFGDKSKSRLQSCAEIIQIILNEAIKYMDFTIIHGNRSPEEQFEIFKHGRSQNEQGVWVIVDSDDVRTYKDGTEKLSKHNYSPSLAVDVAPWPSLWANKGKMLELGGVIKTVQQQLFNEGKIDKMLKWGKDLWDWDEGHYEL